MTITRLRPLPDEQTLADMYRWPHDHTLYGRGHGERVDAMIRAARVVVAEHAVGSVADLSCGNGAVVKATARDTMAVHLGDLAPGWPITGPIEATLPELPPVDLFINGETLEHLDNPAAVLKAVRDKTSHLVLSTPVDNWGDSNSQHLWSWDQAGVEELLTAAGFTIEGFEDVDSRAWGEPYRYGIWRCA